MARYDLARAAGPMPTGVVMDQVLSANEAIINGRRTVTVGTHNYLGLAFDPSCIEAAAMAVRREGTGTCGSRIANGTFAEHAALEEDLAAFHGMRHAMVFSTGYQANLGVISTLVGPGDYLLLDADSHASIYDACKQTQASAIRFKHNDPASLEARLRRLKDEPGNRLVVVEGIYSMLGDVAPLKAIVEVARRYGAYVLVDEAHSFGVLGDRGCGLAEASGMLHEVDFVVGTFSKSFGRGRRLLRLRPRAVRHPARSLPVLYVHRLAAAGDRGFRPRRARGHSPAPPAASGSLEQRPPLLRRAR